MSEQVLCKDCKHSFTPWINWFFVPAHYRSNCRKSLKPAHEEYNPVVGTIRVPEKYEGCSTFRISSKDCGPEAQYWEPRDPKKFFVYLKRV